MSALIHIYCGDGKGKTTAAIGLAIRAAGAGKHVLFTQFFKDGSSSEIHVLQSIPHISCMHCSTVSGFWKNMDDAQRTQVKNDYSHFFEQIKEAAKNVDLLILDEVISASNQLALSEADLVGFLQHKPQELEVVLTGRDPSDELLGMADYVSAIQKLKHPYDFGISARKGIEF